MNYLAHLLLAGPDEETMVGAFLGDFVKGRDLAGFAPVVAREIRLHRLIDTFTDTHPVVQAAQALFEPGRRRYAGIALDVFHDHVLAGDFEHYAGQPLAAFNWRAYRALLEGLPEKPESARRVARRMAEHDWLGSYAEFDNVRQALRGIGRRLSRGSAQLEACAEDLARHHETLAAGFPILLSDLRVFAQVQRSLLMAVDTPV